MRRATISWAVAALGVALIAAGIAINPGRLGTTSWLLLIAPPFLAVGGLLAAKRSRNPIGWLFLGFGFAAALDFAAYQYAYRAVVDDPGSLRAATSPCAWPGTSGTRASSCSC